MKSRLENAEISARLILAKYKAITGKKNAEIADMLGCSLPTVSAMETRPLSVKAQYIMVLDEYLKDEERKRYD